MDNSKYINDYIEQSISQYFNNENPEWLKSFFKEFSKQLKNRSEGKSSGNRHFVSESFSDAFKYLIPENCEYIKQVNFKNFLDLNENNPIERMLMKKRIDFLIACDKKTVLIEFKTNLQFNDLSAAMVEMELVKKFNKLSFIRPIETSSIHLFPYSSNCEGLKGMNILLGSPIDKIWVFCKGPELIFDVNEIIKFRNELLN